MKTSTNKLTVTAISLMILFLSWSTPAFSQDETLGQQIDDLTYRWDLEEQELETYAGLQEFCGNPEYRQDKVQLLNDIHHIDSVLYERASIAYQRTHDKTIHKLMSEIADFESEYSMKSLIRFMKDECNAQKELENNREGLMTEFGSESYDGQAYLIELELQKFVRQTTKKIDHIRKYVHKLEIQ